MGTMDIVTTGFKHKIIQSCITTHCLDENKKTCSDTKFKFLSLPTIYLMIPNPSEDVRGVEGFYLGYYKTFRSTPKLMF